MTCDLDALRLPCPTCGGKRDLGAGTRHDKYETDWNGCPGCDDGFLSIADSLAIVKAVFEPFDSEQFGGGRGLHDYLRSVRAEATP